MKIKGRGIRTKVNESLWHGKSEQKARRGEEKKRKRGEGEREGGRRRKGEAC